MANDRMTARWVGVFFLLAMVTSLAGGVMLEGVLADPGNIPDSASTVTAGVVLEFLNALSVVGIAVLMFPLMKVSNQLLAVGYVVLRTLEAFACALAAMIPMVLLALEGGESGGTLLIALRSGITGLLTPVFFSLGAILLYVFLYSSRRLPRFISIWGLIGALLILVLNLFEFSMVVGALLALPIILNEIFMGIWLLVKGFSAAPIMVQE